MWWLFYAKFFAVFVTAVILRTVNAWLGVSFAFLAIFLYGVYEVYNEYKGWRLSKRIISEIAWHLLRFAIFGIIGAALLFFCASGDPYINDYMEYLEPR